MAMVLVEMLYDPPLVDIKCDSLPAGINCLVIIIDFLCLADEKAIV
jgi:hypothetical protein